MTCFLKSTGSSLLFVLMVFTPFVSGAENADIRTAIYESLLQDASVQDLSTEEMAELVEALALEAEAQGLTASDFVELNPENIPQEQAVETTSCSYPSFICSINEALGFDGGDMRFPLTLGALAGLGVLVLGSMLIKHHRGEAGAFQGVSTYQ